MTAVKNHQTTSNTTLADRIDNFPWSRCYDDLNLHGYTVIEKLLAPSECVDIANSYGQENIFRKQVIMEKHGFGKGEYRYFAYPLPEIIGTIRSSIYPKLVPIANKWNESMKFDVRFPETHKEFIDRCHKAGQVKPTPLILKYKESDYNCLHQDLYGEHVFPLQLATLLSAPNKDFTGGEFVLTEQRPRMQSRVNVVPLTQGDAVIFAVNYRPVFGSRGSYRVTMKHGVSPIRSGDRYTAGVIFHDAN